MKAALLLPFILFASTVSAQQYQIPGAQQQPAWVFPMYFEDGFGYRDTVYLGYDPDAVGSFGIINNPIWNPDTVFAEVYQLIGQDSILNVSLSWGGGGYPYVVKASVNQYGTGYHIMCNHAKLPLTIKWDKSLLYSTVLPFPDQLPDPTVEGIFQVDALASLNYDCGGTEPVIISDSNVFYFDNCTFSDSIVLDLWNCPGCMTNALFYLDFESWDGGWVGVDEKVQDGVTIFPNPFTDALNVEIGRSTGRAEVFIFDALGNKCHVQKFDHSAKRISVNTDSWRSGIYIVQIITETEIFNAKVIKTY